MAVDVTILVDDPMAALQRRRRRRVCPAPGQKRRAHAESAAGFDTVDA